MLKNERRELIVKITNDKNFVKNIELAELTDSTIQTIIKDINDLNNEKKIIKVYGGAKSIQNKLKNAYERFDEEKENLNIDFKQKIGKKAADLIEDGDLIFIDTGTTTKQIANFLIGKNIKIVTNGYSIALSLMEQDIDVCLVGGNIIPSTHAIAGDLALKFLDNFYFDKAFLGMNGFYEKELYTTNIQEASLKEKILNNSSQSFVVMDSSKLNKRNRIKVLTSNDFKVISNEKIDKYSDLFILI